MDFRNIFNKIEEAMASTMLIVAVSRGAKIPGYLADLNLRPALDPQRVIVKSGV